MTQKRRRLRAEERREIILDAARRVFLESGFAGARTRRIAEEAGITEALLYRFFPSKLDIYQAAVQEPLEEFVNDLLDTTNQIEPRSGNPEALRQVNEMLLQFMSDSGPFLAVVLLSEVNEGRRFYESDFHPLLSKPINDVIAKITGWRQPKNETSLIFAAMIGVHMGLAIDAMLRGEDLDVQRTAGQLTQLFSDGIPEEAQAAPAAYGRRRAAS